MTDFSLPLIVCDVAVIGAGPAGLMAAQQLSARGHKVLVLDSRASAGRKFLLAGKGGLNLTHSETLEPFMRRYNHQAAQHRLRPLLENFGPQALRDWAHGLGVETFIGSSGRVFPAGMKAAPLLRAWLSRLRAAGVDFKMRHCWRGWNEQQHLMFTTPQGMQPVQARAVLLALGGASWTQLGSDGRWVSVLRDAGVDVADLRPANCGFDVQQWTPHFAERFAGTPLKSVAIRFTNCKGQTFDRLGEFVVTATGIEGSLIYAAAHLLRDEIAQQGHATLMLDLLPAWTLDKVLAAVCHPRGARSLSSHLKGRLGLEGVKMGLLHECVDKARMRDPIQLAQAIKALPVTVVSPRPLDEAISTAGGVMWHALDEHLMCHQRPGVFCAGEMLDWEAPTGGYLLTACFSTGVWAAQGMQRYLTIAGASNIASPPNAL